MTRASMGGVLLGGCINASLVAMGAGCAGAAPKTTSPAIGAALSPAATGSASAPIATGSAATPGGSASAVSLAPAATEAAPAAVSLASRAVASAEPDRAAAPPSVTAPATSESLATLPVPEAPPSAPAAAPRVLLADELPYSPARLRAHDAKVERTERHHPREREGSATRGSSRGADGLRDHDRQSKRPYHPAPGIVVDVVAAEGGGSATDLQRAARNLGYWPFRQCYEEGLRRDPRLAGKVSLELAINPGGGVDRSVVTATTEHDEIVAACLAREAQRLSLPAGGAATTARLEVSLALGDEPVPSGRPIPNAEPAREALRGSWDAVRRCYAAALAKRPGIGGRMELHFHVRHGEIGEVDEAGGASDAGRFGDADVTRCVLGIYRSTRLPASAHRAHERSFIYALQFESAPVDGARP